MTESNQTIFYPITMIERPFDNQTKDPKGSGAKAVGVPIAVLPKGYKLKNLLPYFEQYRERPSIRKGVTVLDPDSFIRFVNHFKHSEDTVLFITRRLFGGYAVKAVFDYHPPGAINTQTGSRCFIAKTKVKTKDDAINMTKRIAVEHFFGGEE